VSTAPLANFLMIAAFFYLFTVFATFFPDIVFPIIFLAELTWAAMDCKAEISLFRSNRPGEIL
jgi:hypothetical protein